MAEPLLTRYRMLRSGDDGSTWELVGSQDAHNGDSAATKFFGLIDEGVQVVAVPERSWKPLGRRKKESYVNAPVEAEAPAVTPQIDVPLADAEIAAYDEVTGSHV